MDTILKVVIDKPPKFNTHSDDDISDRIAHRITVLILVVFAALVTTKEFFGNGPIQCWAPAHFSGAQEDYTNSFCWIRNTYYLPLDEDVPRGDDYSNRRMVTYYQWIPMILLVQALLFYMPKMFWETLSSRAGINIRDIVMAGENLLKTEMSTEREKTLLYMTRQFDRCV